MEDLKDMLARRTKALRERQRSNYHLARSLGYTGLEANIISNRSRKTILIEAEKEGRTINNIPDVTTEKG